MNIAEGKIEDIQIAGNEKTKDKVILRELRFKKGEPFNKFLASRSMERLYNLGIFEDVNMKLLPGNENHDVIIEIDVVEQKTGVVTVGAGYSESDGMVGILGLTENNFRGTGDKVNFRWEFGGSSHGKNYEISYTHPYINDNGDALGFTVFDRRYKYDDYDSNGDTIAEYDKRKKGFGVSWAHVNGEYRTNKFYLSTTKESYDDEDGFDPGSVMEKYMRENGITDYRDSDWYKKIMDNFGRTNSFTFTHVFDNRDNYFNATKGRRLSFTTEWGGHGLGGDYDYYKFTAEGRFYKALGNGHVLALRLMGGYIDGDISYNNLFDLGGADSLRGYEDDQFKGRKMYEATLEYRIPVAKKPFCLPMWAVPGMFRKARCHGIRMMILSMQQLVWDCVYRHLLDQSDWITVMGIKTSSTSVSEHSSDVKELIYAFFFTLCQEDSSICRDSQRCILNGAGDFRSGIYSVRPCESHIDRWGDASFCQTENRGQPGFDWKSGPGWKRGGNLPE